MDSDGEADSSVSFLPYKKLHCPRGGNAARKRQLARCGERAPFNARMTPDMIRAFCGLDAAGEALLAAAFDRLRDHGVQDVQHSVMDAVLDMGGVPFDRGVHDPLFRVMPYLQFLHRHKGT